MKETLILLSILEEYHIVYILCLSYRLYEKYDMPYNLC